MPDIKFTKDYTVQDAEARKYEAGEVVTGLNDASCKHFVSRGVAVCFDPEAEEKAEAEEETKTFGAKVPEAKPAKDKKAAKGKGKK